ncbi:MAG: CDP-glucose 4,6-dehydratase [Nitrospirae bacterium]|nr:CDP-glucose 4,6-dehydratase [Nitrospirota bacterium]
MFGNEFKDKKVLITGSTGFKGSWLSAWLLKLGAQVFGISKDIPTEPSLFEVLKLSEKINHTTDDIRDLSSVVNLLNHVKPDFVFHLAAQSIVSLSYKDPIETISTNVIGTANVLEALRRINHPCIAVIITSDKCYDNVEWVWGYREIDRLGGKDVYSGSKGAAELIFKSYFQSFLKGSMVQAATARAGNVVGGGDWAADRIVPDSMRAWSEARTVEMRMPNATRPWQHVLEPLSGYLSLATELKTNPSINGEAFNFGPHTENNYSVKTLIEDMARVWGFKDSRQAYKISDNAVFAEAGLLKLNCDKSLYHLGWQPALDYNNMIKFTTLWYYEFYKGRDIFSYTIGQIAEYEAIAERKRIRWAG